MPGISVTLERIQGVAAYRKVGNTLQVYVRNPQAQLEVIKKIGPLVERIEVKLR